MESLIHNQLKTLFTLALHYLAGDGLVVGDGFGVVLPDTKRVVEPDCFYVSRKTLRSPAFHGWYLPNPSRFFGAPEVMCEVVSPSRVDADHVHKMAWYARAGVREFWLATFDHAADMKSAATTETAFPRVLIRIHTLTPGAAVYRKAEYGESAYSDYFGVTIVPAIDKEGYPCRCRLAIVK